MNIDAYAMQDPETGHYINFSSYDNVSELDIRCLRTKRGCLTWKRSKTSVFGCEWAKRYQLVHVTLTATAVAIVKEMNDD